jgi:hypothetical protein
VNLRALIVVAIAANLVGMGCAFASDAAESTFEEREAFRAARACVERGDLVDAERTFRSMSVQGALAPLARYALANVLVMKSADSSDTDSAARVKEAVALYRTLLDSAEDPPAPSDDVRHNLELAKRLLSRQGSGRSNSGSKEDAKSDAKSGDEKSTQEAKTKSESRESHSDRATQSREAAGEVRRPTAGTADADVGELTTKDADARLKRAIDRIENEQAKRFSPPVARPRLPGDY